MGTAMVSKCALNEDVPLVGNGCELLCIWKHCQTREVEQGPTEHEGLGEVQRGITGDVTTPRPSSRQRKKQTATGQG